MSPIEPELLHARDAAAARRELLVETATGLADYEPWIPSSWLYDARGSALFEQITEQPEYHLARAERSLLGAHADEVASLTQAETVVELGAGTARKTRILLHALRIRGTLRRFVPVDVDADTLRTTVTTLAQELPGLELTAVVGDFAHDVTSAPLAGRRLVVFLGSTLGGLDADGRARTLDVAQQAAGPDGWFLVGVDLVRDPVRLRAAYADTAGVSAAFVGNVLTVLNRELAADFDPDGYTHATRWDQASHVMRTGLESLTEQIVHVRGLDLVRPFERGMFLRTGLSLKFDRPLLERELRAAGFSLERWWVDEPGDYALALARRPRPGPPAGRASSAPTNRVRSGEPPR